MSLYQVRKRLQTRSIIQVGGRVKSILNRYGMGQKRFLNTLRRMCQLSQSYHVPITLPITASVLNRYAPELRKICGDHVELAVHGYQHVDYTKLNRKRAVQHFNKAFNLFQHRGIEGKGYRFPYLRRDPHLIRMLAKSGFEWDSSQVVLWDVLNQDFFSKESWIAYQKILKTYQVDHSKNKRSLPEILGDIVEIPVSIPDDDILIERLQISDRKLIGDIFTDMLYQVRDKGEILVLQMHPERFSEFTEPLKEVIKNFHNLKDGWAATLGQVADWWKEKRASKIKVESISRNDYLIEKLGPGNATLMVQGKNIKINCKTIPWDSNLNIIERKNFKIKSKNKPVIGVPLKYSDDDLLFLQEEGYTYEKSNHAQQYNWYLQCKTELNRQKREQIIQELSQVENPLLRFWRWPGNARFCLSITGDIDAITVWDFWERLYV